MKNSQDALGKFLIFVDNLLTMELERRKREREEEEARAREEAFARLQPPSSPQIPSAPILPDVQRTPQPPRQAWIDPKILEDPISLEEMKDPVVASDGFTYERQTIENWFAMGNTRSPMTNNILKSLVLFPNRFVKSLLRQHKNKFRN